eukprot:m.64584 g.64584  ORF g.64584 m.64584 type:complete len:851 (+) comp23447_c0_seq2:389-2941(+)
MMNRTASWLAPQFFFYVLAVSSLQLQLAPDLDFMGLPITPTKPKLKLEADSSTFWVNCATGSDSNDGTSSGSPFRSIARAVNATTSTPHPSQINIAGGLCVLQSAIVIRDELIPLSLSGDGKTAISGGRTITGWKKIPSDPNGRFVADLSNVHIGVEDIKMLRVGDTTLTRGRWPKKHGNGLDTSNFLFAGSSSSGAADPHGFRTGAIAAVLDTLMEITASMNVTVSNLTFLDTTFYADGYWDGPAQQPSDAAVRINYSQNISVSACTFLGLGGNGIAIGNETTDSSVTGCLFDSMGEGGVVLYGYDTSPVPATGGTWAGNNTQPQRIEIAYNVVSSIGLNLVHVAGVVLRAASYCHVHHNRISHSTRYGIQADSFFSPTSGPKSSSRFNLFEFNILNDTSQTTTDTGAIEMLGSGDPADDGGGAGWWTATVIRYNNITNTVGSSSGDGQHVCVHGTPAGPWCRRLVWAIYLDGCQSGVMVYGNIIGASLHGAIFDNAGGNNTHENNIFLGESGPGVASTLMNFGAPGTSTKHPVNTTISGSIVQRNIFYSRDPATTMMAAQVAPFLPELKPNGSDYNLFFNPNTDLRSHPVFPGGKNFSSWQGKSDSDALVMCSNTPGLAGDLIVSHDCGDWKWLHNATDLKFQLQQMSPNNYSYVLNIDCDGDYGHCARGDTFTRVCLDHSSHPWTPHPVPPIVDNQGWVLGDDWTSTTIVAVVSKKCLEVCDRGGAVGGCDGDAGSILQLNDCVPGAQNQLFSFDTASGVIESALAKGLCVAVPPTPPRNSMDTHSIMSNPLFVDAEQGDFTLTNDSPALALGFQPIPKIEAPTSSCGADAINGVSCLEAFFKRMYA